MKKLLILIPFIFTFGCKFEKYGYVRNPEKAIFELYKAADRLDSNNFRKWSKREAFCVYGSDEGLRYLHDNLYSSQTYIESDVTNVKREYLETPRYNGHYFFYYQEQWLINIKEKTTQTSLIKAVARCHFGMSGPANSSNLNLKLNKYNKKRCWIYKLEPQYVQKLSVPKICQTLKVNWP